jgi:hypothetical protein
MFIEITNRELLDYIANLVDERVAEPKDDLISKLVVEQVWIPSSFRSVPR